MSGTRRPDNGPCCGSATRPPATTNHPAPESGRGLECDKLSKEGIEAQFAGLMGKLVADCRALRPGKNAGRHAHRQLGGRLAELDGADAGRIPKAARLRPAALPARHYRPRGRQPGGLRAVPVGPAANDFRPAGRELRRPLPRSWPTQHGMRLSIEAYGGALATK